MLSFELCLIIRDLLEELPTLVSSLLISERLALGASGELTGLLLFLLLEELVFEDAGFFNNFIKSLDLDFLSALILLLGCCCCPDCIVWDGGGGGEVRESASGDAILVVELPLKMPDIVCINVFFWWLFCCIFVTFLDGELGPVFPSSLVDTIPSNFSMLSDAELCLLVSVGCFLEVVVSFITDVCLGCC